MLWQEAHPEIKPHSSCRTLKFDVFEKINYSLPAFIIAFILGPGAERALRQALLLSQDGAMIFLERPMAVLFIVLAVAVISIRIYQTMRAGKASPG